MLSPSVCVQRGHACVMRGVRGLSSQRSLMPCHPGRSLDGITGNWIVSHLLWEQPGWDPPSLSEYLLSPRLPPANAPLFASHYGGTLQRTSCFYMSWQVSPCDAETLELDVSKVLNKVAACMTTAAASEPQHRAVYHPNGGSNMLRSCRVLLNSYSTNLSFLPQKCWGKMDERSMANEQKVHDDKYINIYQLF